MFPMIISVTEVQTIKKIIEEVKKELDEEKIPYKDVELGIHWRSTGRIQSLTTFMIPIIRQSLRCLR